MLDIKFIRENLDLVKMGAKKKHMAIDLDKLMLIDDKRRALLTSVESKKSEQNTVSKQVATTADEGVRATLIENMRTLKDAIAVEEEELKEVMREWQELMLQVPNRW